MAIVSGGGSRTVRTGRYELQVKPELARGMVDLALAFRVGTRYKLHRHASTDIQMLKLGVLKKGARTL